MNGKLGIILLISPVFPWVLCLLGLNCLQGIRNLTVVQANKSEEGVISVRWKPLKINILYIGFGPNFNGIYCSNTKFILGKHVFIKYTKKRYLVEDQPEWILVQHDKSEDGLLTPLDCSEICTQVNYYFEWFWFCKWAPNFCFVLEDWTICSHEILIKLLSNRREEIILASQDYVIKLLNKRTRVSSTEERRSDRTPA